MNESMILELAKAAITGAFVAGGVFAAIKAEFRMMKFRIQNAEDRAEEAHKMIFDHLTKGH